MLMSLAAASRPDSAGGDRAAERDIHGRFPPRDTLAWKKGFLTRPVVDEYTSLLWCAMQRLWPRMRSRSRHFSVRVSHDVDRPRAFDHRSLRDRLWVARDHARKGTVPRLAGSRTLNTLAAVVRLPHRDPFDTFDRIMDADEQQGLRATYYFLCGGRTRYDARYDVGSSQSRGYSANQRAWSRDWIARKLRTMHDPMQLQKERRGLVAVLEEEGLPSEVGSCRQHYLRWQAPATWRAQEAAGLAVDASVGFSEAVGFRSGTSFEHPVFDVESRTPLRLREQPLHIMMGARGNGDQRAFAAIDEIAGKWIITRAPSTCCGITIRSSRTRSSGRGMNGR